MALARAALRVCATCVARASFGIPLRASNKFLRNTHVQSTILLATQKRYIATPADMEYEATSRRLEQAQLMLKIEKFDKAHMLFDNFIKEYPGDVRGYGGRADANQFLKSYDNAIADYKQVLIYAPHCMPALHNIALCHAKQKKYTDALRDLSYLISMDPKYMPAYGTRADVFEACGEIEKAADDYMTLLKFDPSNVDALVGLGKLAMRKGDYDDAKEIYKRVLNLDPNTPSMASRLGFLEYDTQVRDGKPFRENHPHIEAHRTLAVIAYQNGDWNAISPHLDQAKDLELEAETYKPDAVSYVMRGSGYFHLKNYVQAHANLEKALKLQPKNAAGLFLRAGVHYINQDYELAMDDYQTYLQVLEEDPKAAADEFDPNQVTIVLERIARCGRLQFMRMNKVLRKVRKEVDTSAPKNKLVFQDSQAPRDPIQALFVGTAQEESEGDKDKKGKSAIPKKPEFQIRYDEGAEVEYDEALEHIGRMQPEQREGQKQKVFPAVKAMYSELQQEKYANMVGIEYLQLAFQAALQIQKRIELLPPLMQESCLLNVEQVLDCGNKFVVTKSANQNQ